MPPFELSSATKKAIKEHIPGFRKYLASAQYKEEARVHDGNVYFVQKELPGRMDGFSEADLAELIDRLGSPPGGGAYNANLVIRDNGLDKIREELQRLLNTTPPAGRSYVRFLREVRRFGPSLITGVLSYLDPKTCGVWNGQVRKGLRVLGITKPLKYHLSAEEYDEFNQLLRAIGEQLPQIQGNKANAWLSTVFLCYVAKSPPPPPPPEDFDHDEVRDLVYGIGSMLGFDVDKEVVVAHGARVDAVWRARIGNLGQVTYVFEVHKSGSIDSLILNLQKAQSNPTVQKVIAVSDETQLGKIQAECRSLHENFRKAMSFWPVHEVLQVSEALLSATAIIDKLGLLPGQSGHPAPGGAVQ